MKYNKIFVEFLNIKEIEGFYDSYGIQTPYYYCNFDDIQRTPSFTKPGLAVNNFIDGSKYHRSWDWFMPVWKKANDEITGEEYGSSYIGLKAKIIMAICDVNIENACKYLSELITSHLKMQK
jgi:hypothetical protein